MIVKIIKSEYGKDIIKEYRFHDVRKWRFDYAIVEDKIAIEVEGGIWTKGRHIRGTGFIKDMEKYNTATALGWKIIRVTPTTITKCLKYLDEIYRNNSQST